MTEEPKPEVDAKAEAEALRQEYQTFQKVLREQYWSEYKAEVDKAIDNLCRAVTQGPSGWLDLTDKTSMQVLIDPIMKRMWPRIYKSKIQQFLATYGQLVKQFPELVQQAET